MSNTQGEEEREMKNCGFITKTQGACMEKPRPRWKGRPCQKNNENVRTKSVGQNEKKR